MNRWIPVESSALRKVRFDLPARTLGVVYADGDSYAYFKVPRSKFRALLRAESKGKFVNEEIKPRYSYARSSR